MKLCITSKGKEAASEVDPRFGRAQYFIFVDTESGDLEAEENPAVSAPGGAGVRAGQLVSERGTETVLTGNVGPNAFQVLNAAGIRVITGVGGTVEKAKNDFINGVYDGQETSGPTVKGK
jgi:predicted Fe-Mo cluster-binding NifX family protein